MLKKLYCRCLDGLKTGFWKRLWNIKLILVPNPEIKLRKYVWQKCRRPWWEGKQDQRLSRSSRLKSSLKKVLREILHNSQENNCAGISFLITLNSVDLQLHWKRVFSAGFSLWNFAKFVRTPFKQNTTRRLPEQNFWSKVYALPNPI